MNCSYCGKQLKENAAFCSYCGKPVSLTPSMGDTAPSIPLERKKRSRAPLFIGLLLAFIVILVAVFTVNSFSTSSRVRRQIDLGNRYLSELKYEQAIAAFDEALSIDSKNEDALSGMENAYLSWSASYYDAGDLASASDVLQQGIDQLSQYDTHHTENLQDALNRVESGVHPLGEASASGQDGASIPDEPEITEQSVNSLLETHLEQVLVPEKGVFQLSQSGTEKGPHYGDTGRWIETYGTGSPPPWHDATGIFAVDFYDYDQDSFPEMLVIYGQENEAPHPERRDINGYYEDRYIVKMDLYDTEGQTVILSSSLTLDCVEFDGFLGVPGGFQIMRGNYDGLVQIVFHCFPLEYYQSGVGYTDYMFQVSYVEGQLKYTYGLHLEGVMASSIQWIGEYDFDTGQKNETYIKTVGYPSFIPPSEINEILHAHRVAASYSEGAYTAYGNDYVLLFMQGTVERNSPVLIYEDLSGFHDSY